MNLTELEVLAGRILEEKKRQVTAEGELERVKQDLREAPKRNEKDKRFFALIGLDWQEPAQIKQRSEELTRDLETIGKTINESYVAILKGVGEAGLVVPLDPNFASDGGKYVFRYRMGASYPNSVQELTELLGLAAPLTVDNVSILPDRIEVNEVDAYFAKLRIVEAFDKITKNISLKLAPRASTQW